MVSYQSRNYFTAFYCVYGTIIIILELDSCVKAFFLTPRRFKCNNFNILIIRFDIIYFVRTLCTPCDQPGPPGPRSTFMEASRETA